jgi:phosphoglycerate dehydrogenase-like enzyme
LENQLLRLAAVDVFDMEPLPEADQLSRTRGLIATPHIGYVTAEQFEMFYQDSAENIRAWAKGSPIRVMGL